MDGKAFKSNGVKKILLILSIFLIAAACSRQPWTPEKVTPAPQRQQIQVIQKVEGAMSDELFNFYPEENKTALDLLKLKHKVETKSFGSAGEFVEAIDGKKLDGKKEFWAFYINGEQAPVGASSYKLKNGDKIEWKVEEIK